MLRRIVHTALPVVNRGFATFNIGDIRLPLHVPGRRELVPRAPASAFAYLTGNSSHVSSFLRWLGQKDLLGQDVCITANDASLRRWLAVYYCQLTHREVQFVSLTRDTTEADLKQRKEIRQSSLFYENQAAVVAATLGHVLVIDGLEKAERNVLPVLNNLLENREMNLDDGRMLIHHHRFDELAARIGEHAVRDMGLVRVHERFRVIALTAPSASGGTPLDPPLRSRFQCLHVPQSDTTGLWRTLHASRDRTSENVESNWPVAESVVRLSNAVNAAKAGATSTESGENASASSCLPLLGTVEGHAIARCASRFPAEPLQNIVARVYPWKLYCLRGSQQSYAERVKESGSVLKRCNVSHAAAPSPYRVNRIGPKEDAYAVAHFDDGSSVPVARGPSDPSTSNMIRSSFHDALLSSMVQSHACERHMMLVGPSGCGKTTMVRDFAAALGYTDVETVHLYADMTTRDLLQRRATVRETGDTVWEPSGLINAALHGGIAVLDGVDQLAPGSLAAVETLLVDGSIHLHDGSLLKSASDFDRLLEEVASDIASSMAEQKDAGFNATDAAMSALKQRRVYRIHPSFRVIATARPPTQDHGKKFWLTPGIGAMFDVHSMTDMPESDVKSVVHRAGTSVTQKTSETHPWRDRNAVMTAAQVEQTTEKLVSLKNSLEAAKQRTPNMPQLSLRQMLRIMTYAAVFPKELRATVEETLLLSLVTPLIAEQVVKIVDSHVPRASTANSPSSAVRDMSRAMVARVTGRGPGEPTTEGDKAGLVAADENVHGVLLRSLLVDGECLFQFALDAVPDAERALVPHVMNFYDNALHRRVAGWLAKQLALKSPILLVGNQGVGKNKIVDHVLSTAQLPRHYVQLHRDTTVSSLTINPSVQEGRIVWEDSPLVKAVTSGHVLVVDEIDKAPVEVVQLLKGLVEDRELRLADGRVIRERGEQDDATVIPLHPNFRIVVLANPPGFPFHGHDFYRECGDLFATYVLGNPDSDSQLALVRKYGPGVPIALLIQLVSVFRALNDEWKAGHIQYPFSTRELIAVVKHLQAFPADGVYQALNNVFMFDAADQTTMDSVRRVLHRHLRRNAGSADVALTAARETPLRTSNVEDSDIAFEDRGVLHVASGSLRVERSSLFPSSGEHASKHLTLAPQLRVSTAGESAEGDKNTGSARSTMDEVKGSLDLSKVLDEACDIVCDRQVPSHKRSAQIVSLVKLENNTVTLLVRVDYDDTSALALATVTAPGPVLSAAQCPLPQGKVCINDLRPAALASDAQLLSFGSRSDVVLVSPSTGAVLSIEPTSGSCTLAWIPCDTPLSTKDGQKINVPPPPLVLDSTGVMHGAATFVASGDGSASCCILEGSAVHAVEMPAGERVVRSTCVAPGQYHVATNVEGAVASEVGERHYVLHMPRVDADSGERIPGEAQLVQIVAGKPGLLDGFRMLPSGTETSAPGAAKPDSELSGVSNKGNKFFSLSMGGSASAGARGQMRSSQLDQSFNLSDSSFDPNSRQFMRTAANGALDVADMKRNTMRSIESVKGNSAGAAGHHIDPTGHGAAVTSGSNPELKTFDALADRIEKDYSHWQKATAGDASELGSAPSPKELDMWYSESRKTPSGNLKHGEEDDLPHHGGNNFAGGTGGTDTAGLGGLVGPYRLDKGWNIHQVDPEAKKKVPQHLIDDAKRMGKEALQQRLNEIGMSQREFDAYMHHFQSVQSSTHQLRNLIEGLKSKNDERMWLKHQSDGLWDDAKIVEGLTGERNVFKRRIDQNENDDALRSKSKKRKRLLFLFDVSASMYRFNRHDQRLERLVECAVLITEALHGFEDTIEYSIVGHNGDAPNIPLIPWRAPPKNRKERSDVCSKIIAHSQFCWSGDTTLESMRLGLQDVVNEDAEDYFVFMISDANLHQYGYHPSDFSKLITQDARVQMYCIFIASFGAQASRLQHQLPAGRAFECFDTRDLPRVLKRIFVATNLLAA